MAGKVVEKDAAVKVAGQRLSVLEMAKTLVNISEACRQDSMDRPNFYGWKRRFQTYGLEGLKDMPPIPKSQPTRQRRRPRPPLWNAAKAWRHSEGS